MRQFYQLIICFILIPGFGLPEKAQAQPVSGTNLMELRQPLSGLQWLPDPGCIRLNPALTVQWNQAVIELQSKRLYGFPEFGVYSLTSVLPVSLGKFGLSVSHFGWNQFASNQFYLSYGKKLSPVLAAGTGFQLEQQRIPGIPSQLSWSGQLGCLLQLNESFTGHFSLSRTQITASTPPRSTISWNWMAGLDGRLSEQSMVSCTLWQEHNQQPLFATCLYYQFHRMATAWLGFETAVRQWYTGVGWQRNYLRISLSVSRHWPLGWSPEVQAIFFRNAKKGKHA